MQCSRREWTGRQCAHTHTALGKEVSGSWAPGVLGLVDATGEMGGQTQVQVQVQGAVAVQEVHMHTYHSNCACGIPRYSKVGPWEWIS